MFYEFSCSLPDLTIKLPSGSIKSSTTSRATNRVPAIVGGVLGSVAVILLAFLYLRQRRTRVQEDQHFAIPLLVTPFTSEFYCEESESGQPKDAAMPPLVSSPVRRHPQKLTPDEPEDLAKLRINSHARIDLEGSGNVAGSSTRTPLQDNDLRREVEQLRMVVETLREEQVHPPPFVYQDTRNMPDEPPPEYRIPTQQT